VVKQGFASVAPKGYSASLKTPLFDEAAPLVDIVSMKTPLFDEAAPLIDTCAPAEACSEGLDMEMAPKKITTAGHAAMLVKSGTGKFTNAGVAVADVVMKKFKAIWRLPGARVNSECVQQLVGMGFPRKDILRAVRTLGTDDLSLVVEFLCQDPIEQMLNMGFAHDEIVRAVRATGTSRVSSVVAFLCHEPLPMSRERTQRVATGVARRIVELEYDENEDVQLALALSQFEAEISACNGGELPEDSQFKAYQWWDGTPAGTDSPRTLTKEVDLAFQMRPSVGTWIVHLPRNPRSAAV
jgi:hypothetical protein